jgi:hypothetical protein
VGLYISNHEELETLLSALRVYKAGLLESLRRDKIMHEDTPNYFERKLTTEQTTSIELMLLRVDNLLSRFLPKETLDSNPTE